MPTDEFTKKLTGALEEISLHTPIDVGACVEFFKRHDELERGPYLLVDSLPDHALNHNPMYNKSLVEMMDTLYPPYISNNWSLSKKNHVRKAVRCQRRSDRLAIDHTLSLREGRSCHAD